MNFYTVSVTILILKSKMRGQNVWSKCTSVFNKTSSKCPKCLFNSLNHKVNYDPYKRTSSQHPTEKPEIHVGKPFMVNPCPQESAYDVMKHIQNICSFSVSDGIHILLHQIFKTLCYSVKSLIWKLIEKEFLLQNLKSF